MKPSLPPRLDHRRAADFSAEMQERARAWIADWGLAEGERDLGLALLEIAARFNSEVAERLDGAGEKMRRGFLDWLAVRGEAARPARMPVVFKLNDSAREGVLASAPVRIQADVAGAQVVFETEKDVRVVPGKLEVVVGVDATKDAYYLPPPGLSDLSPLETLPVQWQVKGFAAAKAKVLQLDPEIGLEVDMIIEALGSQYRITQVDKGIVTIEPGLEFDLDPLVAVRKVVSFSPFANPTRSRQEHAIYLGDMDLLNIDAAATITVIGTGSLVSGVKWQYWGKRELSDKPEWQPLTPAPSKDQQPDAIVLNKPKGSIEPLQIGATNSRWIRAFAQTVDGVEPALQVDSLKIRINYAPTMPACDAGTTIDGTAPLAEGMANTTPLVLENVFFPLGKEPRQFDAFYLGCQEAFSKKTAEIQLCFTMAEARFESLSSILVGPQDDHLLAGQAADGCLHLFRFNAATKDIKRFQDRDPLRPPSPGPTGLTITAPPVVLDQTPPGFRAPVWSIGAEIFVAVSARNAVWIWKEDTATPSKSGWMSAGLVGVNEVPDTGAPITGLVYLSDASKGHLFAVRGAMLFTCNLGEANLTWQRFHTKPPSGTEVQRGIEVQLSKITPVRTVSTIIAPGNLTEGLVGISTNNELYAINAFDFRLLEATYTQLMDNVDVNVEPAAVRSPSFGDRFIAVAVDNSSSKKLQAYSTTGPGFPLAPPVKLDEVPLHAVKIVGNSIDVNLMGGNIFFGVCVNTVSNGDVINVWSPFDRDPHPVLIKRTIPTFVNAPAGAPTLLPNHVLLPTASSEVIVATFAVERFSTPIGSALIKSRSMSTPSTGDHVAIPVASTGRTHKLAEVRGGVLENDRTLFEFDVQSIDGDVFLYRSSIFPFAGTIANPSQLNKLTIATDDNSTRQDAILLVTTDKSSLAYKVTELNEGVATLDPELDVSDRLRPPKTVRYASPFIATPKTGEPEKMFIDALDNATAEETILLVITDNTSHASELFRVVHFDSAASTATLDRPHNSASEIRYTLPLTATTHDDPAKITVDGRDLVTSVGKFLLITTDITKTASSALYKVVSSEGSRVFKLDPPLVFAEPINPPASVSYQIPELSRASLLPLLHLDPETNGNWKSTRLAQEKLIFPGAIPERMDGEAFKSDANGRPEYVTLTSHWTQPPPIDGVSNEAQFLFDVSLDDWIARLGDPETKPELSWEYWNGKGWWKLPVIFDGPQNLKISGALRFNVPEDIALSDWAGKENFWIRARLIGGDYGKETVTVVTQDKGNGKTEQTVDRSQAGIRAPSVVKLDISYRVCRAVQPTFVLAQDSGTIRDQSDANRTEGAIVEAFIPIAAMLKRLSQIEPTAIAPAIPGLDNAAGCGCEQPAQTVSNAEYDKQDSEAASVDAVDRSLFIGLDAMPSEAPVNVLLLVDEHDYGSFSPMKIEALIADRFVPIVADDATRALGESGVISLSFTIPPTRSELFGRKNLTWLRLIPQSSSDKWMPTIRGAYLNAVWASATESLTRELLGSSIGEPNLTLRLARPPVLHNTLELRVKEPLGEEERQTLLDQDPTSVLSSVEQLPGDWVLWKQVTDPDDETADKRVYALDESTGEIRFGDGIHGRIPPIGRDSIVAFRYSRTEPDPTGSDRVPANSIEARTALNLVSPVDNVENVIAADQAAGGAPPESDDRVLRFGFARLRHRNRAVTLRDIEDIALQSSPDIVQARAFVRRGCTRLVVVMRGMNPQPNAAQVRELRRLLLEAASVTLGAPGALSIEGPKIRKLRIDLILQVETLDRAGTLSAFIKKRLNEFFNTAVGGIDKDGWALGVNPSAEDIALALLDAPNLESILDIKLLEIADDGEILPTIEAIKATELVMLSDDPIRIEYHTVEVTP